MKAHEAYKALPSKVSQQVLMVLDKNWKSFFEALKAYNEDPSKFLGRPKLPKYKHKTDGRNLLIYTLQALAGGQSKQGIQGIIKPCGLPITVTTCQKKIKQVRIVPRKGFYVIEVIYEQETAQAKGNSASYAGIDIGIDNLVALTSNQPGFVPVLVNGRPVKSVNQFYVRRVTHFSIAPAGSQKWKECSGVI
jgi:transposase